MLGAPGDRKKVSGSLELEVWMVIGHDVGAGN